MKIRQVEGNKVLCKKCGTKYYKLINNHKEKIIAHKRNCPLMKKLMAGSVEI